MRSWLAVILVWMGCSGSAQAPARHESAPTASLTVTHESASPPPSTAPAAPSTPPITLTFAWPWPAQATVHVVSHHDFGDGVFVSASYHYELSVRADDHGIRISRTDITLEEHAGAERLRLGNVLAQDVMQHVGELHIDADGTHIAPTEGFDPIEAAARSVLSDAGMTGPLADAVLSLGRAGWQPLNVVDYDTMIHEWNGRAFVLGVIQPADAMGADVSATRILSRANAPCDESPNALSTCVELVRTEQGERGSDRIEHVYTLLAEPTTLRPHSFQHESRTDSEAAHLHYAETWTTTFAWR